MLFDDDDAEDTCSYGDCQHVPDSLTSVAEKEVSKTRRRTCSKGLCWPRPSQEQRETDAGQYGGGQP